MRSTAESTITADRSGRYLLIASLGTGTGEIFRWTFGMRYPVKAHNRCYPSNMGMIRGAREPTAGNEDEPVP